LISTLFCRFPILRAIGGEGPKSIKKHAPPSKRTQLRAIAE